MPRISPDGFPRRTQRGQALIYGLFMLVCGLVALFFVFNTGQLTLEKTKLVNTADAVAYSAGVLHARALNFDSYTNRALMANEVIVAQTVSIASWISYAKQHAEDVPPLACYSQYSLPVGMGVITYVPLCYALSWQYGRAAVEYADEAIQPVAEVTVGLSEVAKTLLQLSQKVMFYSLVPARYEVMEDVAKANYQDDGTVKVDTIPLTDEWLRFDGGAFISSYSGDDRARFKDAAVTAANKDEFVANRDWDAKSIFPCMMPTPTGEAIRRGSTSLEGYDDWKAQDNAHYTAKHFSFDLFSFGCKTDWTLPLGSASQSAADWSYKGIPNFYDLSKKALAYGPDNSDTAKRDPRLRFAIRLTRDVDQQRTSAGRSQVKPAGQMAIYAGKQAHDVMAAVATSEVFWERPLKAGSDETEPNQTEPDKTELASLFNPYWKVRLIGNSTTDIATAIALQAGAAQ